MNLHIRHLDRAEHQETRELVKSAFSLARALSIKVLVVQADEISDRRLVEQLRDDERVIWVVRERKQMPSSDPARDVVLAMPDAPLNRHSQLNLALFLTALNRHLGPEEQVLGLSGVTGSQRLDTLVIAKPARDGLVAAASQERNGRDAASRQVTGNRLTLRPRRPRRIVYRRHLRAGRPPHTRSSPAPVDPQSLKGPRAGGAEHPQSGFP